MLELVQKVATLVAALTGFVLAAEQEGNGQEKKKKAVESMKEFVKSYGKDNLPNFVYDLFQNEDFLSPLLEILVWSLKKFNLLK